MSDGREAPTPGPWVAQSMEPAGPGLTAGSASIVETIHSLTTGESGRNIRQTVAHALLTARGYNPRRPPGIDRVAGYSDFRRVLDIATGDVGDQSGTGDTASDAEKTARPEQASGRSVGVAPHNEAVAILREALEETGRSCCSARQRRVAHKALHSTEGFAE